MVTRHTDQYSCTSDIIGWKSTVFIISKQSNLLLALSRRFAFWKRHSTPGYVSILVILKHISTIAIGINWYCLKNCCGRTLLEMIVTVRWEFDFLFGRLLKKSCDCLHPLDHIWKIKDAERFWKRHRALRIWFSFGRLHLVFHPMWNSEWLFETCILLPCGLLAILPRPSQEQKLRMGDAWHLER